jgi:hypothetical protein
MLHAGTAWMRLKFANGSRPFCLHAASTEFIAGLDPPYGANGARVCWSATNSTAQNTPSPRTSPTQRCLAASSRSPGPRTSEPMRLALATMPSSSMALIVATAAAHASG